MVKGHLGYLLFLLQLRRILPEGILKEMSDKGSDKGGSDPWTYQCGKCGSDFKTAAERDQVMKISKGVQGGQKLSQI